MKVLNVALIGAGFMGKAHSLAYSSLPMHFLLDGVKVNKKVLVDLSEDVARESAMRFGFEEYTTDWKEVINNPAIDIIDIVTPNGTHAEIAIAAAKAGKHVICEKPLARNSKEAREMLEAALEAGIVHGTAYNYRRVPAIALAKKYIEENDLGKVLNFRGLYSQDWCADKNVPFDWHHSKSQAGSGSIGDIGTHIIDLARFLVGNIDEVIGMEKTWIPDRLDKDKVHRKVDVDDQTNALVKFVDGALGSLEVTRNAWGRKNYLSFEIHCEKGSLFFDYERLEELKVCFFEDASDRNGWKTIQTGRAHPYGENLWQDGIGIGYVEIKTIEIYEFIKAIVESTELSPDFKDGYEACLIGDAITKSIEDKEWTKVSEVRENGNGN